MFLFGTQNINSCEVKVFDLWSGTLLLKPWIIVSEAWVLSPKIFEDLEATGKLLLQTGEPKYFGNCEISSIIKTIALNVNIYFIVPTNRRLKCLCFPFSSYSCYLEFFIRH